MQMTDLSQYPVDCGRSHKIIINEWIVGLNAQCWYFVYVSFFSKLKRKVRDKMWRKFCWTHLHVWWLDALPFVDAAVWFRSNLIRQLFAILAKYLLQSVRVRLHFATSSKYHVCCCCAASAAFVRLISAAPHKIDCIWFNTNVWGQSPSAHQQR